MKIKLLLLSGGVAACSFAYSQELRQQVTERKEYYQIFLDAPVQKVNKVSYYDDSGPVEFKLSPDGKAIYLLNYKGKGGIKAEVVDMEGVISEIIRNHCKIHSLQEL